MGKYLEIAQKALSQTPISIAEDRCTTEDQQLKGDSDAPVPFTHCEISEISEISPVTDQELKEVLEDDWDEVSTDPAQLKAAADSLMTEISRKRGIVPSHYTATVHCQNCNQDVPHFPVGDDTVEACVWCWNGQLVPTNSRS